MKRYWSESMSSSQKKVHVTELLLQGRELANQLHMALKWPALNKDEVRGLAEGLAVRIFESFMNSVLILNGIHGANEVLDSQIQANTTTVPTVVDASSWGAHGDFVKSETRHGSCKITETVKDRRGSYKRRKTTHSWTKDSHAWVDDGHGWRKYGQKTILDTRHPRNYFRCSHKFEQGCKATKQVQQIQDTPKLFRTTYYDNHTCTDYLKAPELFMDCSRPRESSSNMIRFDNTENDLETEHEHPFFSSFTAIKRETIKEEDMISPISEDHPGQNKSSVLSDCLPPTDPTTIELDYDDMIFRLMEGHFDDLKFLI